MNCYLDASLLHEEDLGQQGKSAEAGEVSSTYVGVVSRILRRFASPDFYAQYTSRKELVFAKDFLIGKGCVRNFFRSDHRGCIGNTYDMRMALANQCRERVNCTHVSSLLLLSCSP